MLYRNIVSFNDTFLILIFLSLKIFALQKYNFFYLEASSSIFKFFILKYALGYSGESNILILS